MNRYEILEYLLRLSVIWGILLLTYFGLLRNNANWKLHRTFLLVACGLGLLIPLLPGLAADQLPIALQIGGGEVIIADTMTTPSPEQVTIPWISLLLFLYFTGAVLVGGSHILPLIRAYRWKKTGLSTNKREPLSADRIIRENAGDRFAPRYPIVRHPRVGGPFAIWGAVFLPPKETNTLAENMAVLHETLHLRKSHPVERLLLLPLKTILWFHPLSWLFDRLLSDVHEFEVDAEVARTYPKKKYALQLLQGSMRPTFAGAPNLFSSPLKKRIHMLIQPQKTYTFRPIQWAFLLILVLGLSVACSDLREDVGPDIVTVAGEDLPPPSERIIPRLTNLGPEDVDKTNEEVLLHHIYRDIKYPAEARQKGLVGDFEVNVHIGTDGAIETTDIRVHYEPKDWPAEENAIVITGYGEPKTFPSEDSDDHWILGSEILKTVESMGPFEPTVVNGKATKNWLNLKFSYRLE